MSSSMLMVTGWGATGRSATAKHKHAQKLHKIRHCTKLDNAYIYTLHKTTHCTKLHISQNYTLNKKLHWTKLNIAQNDTLHKTGLCKKNTHCTKLGTAKTLHWKKLHIAKLHVSQTAHFKTVLHTTTRFKQLHTDNKLTA